MNSLGQRQRAISDGRYSSSPASDQATAHPVRSLRTNWPIGSERGQPCPRLAFGRRELADKAVRAPWFAITPGFLSHSVASAVDTSNKRRVEDHEAAFAGTGTLALTPGTVGYATFSIPSPRPSPQGPQGRGRIVRPFWAIVATEFAKPARAKHGSGGACYLSPM